MKTVHLNIHDDLHQYLLKVKDEAGKQITILTCLILSVQV